MEHWSLSIKRYLHRSQKFPLSLNHCYYNDSSSRKVYLSSRNDLYVPLMLVFILSVSFISPLNCFSFASAPLNFPLSSTIPRATPSISSSYFLLLSPPPTSRVKNINTGTSYTSSTVYIFLPLQGKEVNFFFVRFGLSTFPPLPSLSLSSSFPFPSLLSLPLSSSPLPSPPLLSGLLHFVSIFLQVTQVNTSLF